MPDARATAREAAGKNLRDGELFEKRGPNALLRTREASRASRDPRTSEAGKGPRMGGERGGEFQ